VTWISVEDRLPEPETDILISDGRLVRMSFLYEDYSGHCFANDDLLLDEITHWMPLPEPPDSEDK
jgi:hypothetical protein